MAKSTDSRKHGPVKKSAIFGRVVAGLPGAVKPVQPRQPQVKYLSWLLAFFMVLLSVANLSQIGSLVVALDGALPGGQTFAAWVTVIAVLSQVFAIPYLLALKLSPLGHVASGFLSVMAPLIWSLIAIWNLGNHQSIGLFANVFAIPANLSLTILLVLWLAVSYANLYFRNFELQAKRLAKTT